MISKIPPKAKPPKPQNFQLDFLQWRAFARTMDGVVRIGAVNCAEDPELCQSHRVMGYPSLVLFPQVAKKFGEISEILGQTSQKSIPSSPKSFDTSYQNHRNSILFFPNFMAKIRGWV